MTMFTKRCSHHGPWRTEFASSFKTILLLFLLSSFFVSTYGQSVNLRQSVQSQLDANFWWLNNNQSTAPGAKMDYQRYITQNGVVYNESAISITPSQLPFIGADLPCNAHRWFAGDGWRFNTSTSAWDAV